MSCHRNVPYRFAFSASHAQESVSLTCLALFAAKCVNQVCGMEAFGCTQVGCDKGGITYRLVSRKTKTEHKIIAAGRCTCVSRLPQLYLCEHRLTLGYTFVILQVEVELKAELQKQCKAISQSPEIQFQWILPPESPESASSAVNMVCNGEAFHCGSARYECFHAPLGSDMGDAQ